MPTPDFILSLRKKIGHELLLVPTAGTFIFDEQGRVLLVRHSEGIWTNPGGIVEPFETVADAAVRETLEETGLTVELTNLIGIFGGEDHHIVYSNGDEMNYTATMFEARIVSGELRPDGEETLDARYFMQDEALALDTKPQKRRHLEVVFDRTRWPYFDPPSR
jgi:ADP-ribose pyrophosphatase YjhB (NUDIX family)